MGPLSQQRAPAHLAPPTASSRTPSRPRSASSRRSHRPSARPQLPHSPPAHDAAPDTDAAAQQQQLRRALRGHLHTPQLGVRLRDAVNTAHTSPILQTRPAPPPKSLMGTPCFLVRAAPFLGSRQQVMMAASVDLSLSRCSSTLLKLAEMGVLVCANPTRASSLPSFRPLPREGHGGWPTGPGRRDGSSSALPLKRSI